MVLLSAVDGIADLIILKSLGYIFSGRYKLMQHSGVASLCEVRIQPIMLIYNRNLFVFLKSRDILSMPSNWHSYPGFCIV